MMTADIQEPPEVECELPCQACGCHAAFTAIAAPGARDNPLFLRCSACGKERTDLAAYYGELLDR